MPAHRRLNLNLPVAATSPRPSHPPAPPGDAVQQPPSPRLVLVALGAPTDPAGPALLPPAAAARLGALMGLPVRPIPDPADPDAALASLVAPPGPWLAPLSRDPGLALPAGSCWAEALGAWRQPVLLLVGHGQLVTGLPAAATALLLQRGVPLVGLIQCGGPWDGQERRRDGLPWLGWLAPPSATTPEPTADAEAALLAALSLRWRQIVETLR